MTAVDTTLINLLGKTVSFVYSYKSFDFDQKGVVTHICFSLSGECEISLDDGDFYSFSVIENFTICD